MIHYATRIIQLAALIGAISSAIYYLICWWSASVFLRRQTASRSRPALTEATPPISILKPLKGTDPEIYECLRSHCLQDYPEYEIIFGASDPNDPAIATVKRLQSEFPANRIQLIVCPKILGANIKVSNLAQMLPFARHDHLIVNDSDIRVESSYLRRVIAPLADPTVGMVTCLYRGVAAPSLGSRLEALGISTDFCAGVLAARQLEGGMRFGLGSTLAFRRGDVQLIGGFESFADYLADDYELGRRIADLGLKVELSDVVVETVLPPYSVHNFLQHQLRWSRAIRDARVRGYVGLIFTFGLMWSVVTVILANGARWSWELFASVSFLRLLVALVIGRVVLADRQLLRNLWLFPLRDLTAVAVWITSFAGHTVSWRGDNFHLRNGKLSRAAPR
ncbi:MAG: glycosyl transferase [Acidobacteria bacterium]|nr:MAG: glycosyl transferase [Acidobacteriota bacterium]